jgi:hypothetical protein
LELEISFRFIGQFCSLVRRQEVITGSNLHSRVEANGASSSKGGYIEESGNEVVHTRIRFERHYVPGRLPQENRTTAATTTAAASCAHGVANRESRERR